MSTLQFLLQNCVGEVHASSQCVSREKITTLNSEGIVCWERHHPSVKARHLTSSNRLCRARYLADLWPEGWLVPSILRRFRTMTPEERDQQTMKMEELEAERDLVEGIRAGVAAAAKVIEGGFSSSCFTLAIIRFK